MDYGLYVSVRRIQEADEPDGKRFQEVAGKVTHSKVASLGLQGDYMKVKSNSLLTEIQLMM